MVEVPILARKTLFNMCLVIRQLTDLVISDLSSNVVFLGILGKMLVKNFPFVLEVG